MADFQDYINSDAESAMDKDVPLLFLSFPSAKDPNWKLHPGRENKSTMALVTISKYDWFKSWKVIYITSNKCFYTHCTLTVFLILMNCKN